MTSFAMYFPVYHQFYKYFLLMSVKTVTLQIMKFSQVLRFAKFADFDRFLENQYPGGFYLKFNCEKQ